MKARTLSFRSPYAPCLSKSKAISYKQQYFSVANNSCASWSGQYNIITMRAVLSIVGAVVVSFILYGAVRIHERNAALEHQLNGLKSQVASLEAENARFQEDIDFYSQPENLEKEARARLNLKKPGETLVIIPNGSQKNSSGSESEEGGGEKKPESFWQRIKSFFSKD